MDPSMEERTYGCDTEVMDIDITRESPCCHGIITCFSLYCGPDMHFGSDPAHEGDVKKNMIWVDTWLNGEESKKDEAKAILETFRVFFESERHKKVWHNYSFDRHVIERMGIVCRGFYGDTMHMARLWDSSRTGRGGYSLEALSGKLYYHVFALKYLQIVFSFLYSTCVCMVCSRGTIDGSNGPC
jgi:DNA polymerase-1